MAGGAASRSPSSHTAHLPSPEILSCSPWMAHLPSHQRLTLKITPLSSNPSFLDLQDTTCLQVSSYLTIISLPFPAWEAPSLPVALGELWMFWCLIRLVWGSRGIPTLCLCLWLALCLECLFLPFVHQKNPYSVFRTGPRL